MSETELNLDSISQDTYWANQLVPLPPTQFPSDAIFGGTDPFVNVEVSQAEITQAPKLDTQLCRKMEVEIVGQADLAPLASSVAQDSPAGPLNDFNKPNETLSQTGGSAALQSQAPNLSAYSPDAYIAASLSGNDSTVQFAGSDANAAVAAGRTSLVGPAAKPSQPSYWDQFAQASFVPGVTPIEAYPVCSDFEQKVPVADAGPETSGLLAVEQLQQQQLADTDYFFLAAESPDEATEDSTSELSSVKEVEAENGVVENGEVEEAEANDSLDLAREPVAPNAIDATDAIDVTDSLPQLPSQDSTAGQRLLTSVEGTLSGLHQSIAEQSKKQSSAASLQDEVQVERSPERVAEQTALTAQADAESSAQAEIESTAKADVDESPVEETAVAEQSIEVDGKDGFDFLDLSAFEPKQATFMRGQILLDAGDSKIRVSYKNIALAIFTNGIEITLQ